jgi:methylated-DNA-[protein]-cysteine S-methyltransferase
VTEVARDRLAWGSLDTPVGRLSVACGATGLTEVTYAARRRPAASLRPAVLARGGDPPEPPDAAALAAAKSVHTGPPSAAGMMLSTALGELEEYFAGRRRSFSVPVDLSATSGARRSVLSVLHDSVGFGETITYGALAARAGLTDGEHTRGTTLPPARVVGQIMASNPCAVIVPCHRVVAGGGLGGYSGGAGPDIKQWLLIFEGALPPTLDWSPEGVALPG